MAPSDRVAEPDGDGATRREYRIDELARLAGTTVRNVRAYQDRGLLPPPRRQGRVGWYGDSHLGRLRVIGDLLGRGYTLANIAELVAGWESGRDLSRLLGLERALLAPWGDDRATSVTVGEVRDYLGRETADELLAQGEEHRLLRRVGDTVEVDNPRMLEGAAVLIGAGVPVQDVLDLGVFLADTMGSVADRYVELLEQAFFVGDAPPRDEDLPGLASLVDQLRPLARQVVDAELALALERRIQAELGERLARLGTRGRAAG